MSNDAKNNDAKTVNERPLWQRVSGIDPKREDEMTADERDAAIRKLITEVRRRAIEEFERDDAGKIPNGERSIFWDPLQRICMQMGISRTKLSSYSRELTGLRAHEITDSIHAKRKAPERLRAWVTHFVGSQLESRRRMFSMAKIDGAFRLEWVDRMIKWLKDQRSGEARASFAAGMGFANYSRLSRACLVAFGKSIDHLESDLVCTEVQKFLEQFGKEDLTQSREERKEQKETDESWTPAAQKFIKDIVDAVVKGEPKKDFVAA